MQKGQGRVKPGQLVVNTTSSYSYVDVAQSVAQYPDKVKVGSSNLPINTSRRDVGR